MNIDKIQNTNTAFGAKILLKGDNVRKLINYENKQWADEILDKFQKSHPEDIVQISYRKISDWKPYNMALYAENLATGESAMYPAYCEDVINNPEKLSKCNSLYNFLEYLLDSNHFGGFDNFWKKEIKAAKEYTNADLAKHSVFIS